MLHVTHIFYQQLVILAIRTLMCGWCAMNIGQDQSQKGFTCKSLATGISFGTIKMPMICKGYPSMAAAVQAARLYWLAVQRHYTYGCCRRIVALRLCVVPKETPCRELPGLRRAAAWRLALSTVPGCLCARQYFCMSRALAKMPATAYKLGSIWQSLPGKGLTGTPAGQVLHGSKGNSSTSSVANDAKNGLVDIAEETYNTVQEVVQVIQQAVQLLLRSMHPQYK